MKKLLLFLFALSIGLVFLSAEYNFREMQKACQLTDMSDSDCERVALHYGFNSDVMEPITVKNKIVAIFSNPVPFEEQ